MFEILHTFSYAWDQINSKTADRLICLFYFAMVSAFMVWNNFTHHGGMKLFKNTASKGEA
jgi:hypothetical protein